MFQPKLAIRSWWVLIAASAITGPLLAGGGVVLRVPTAHGTLIVESDDPDAEVLIKPKVGAIIRTKRGEVELRLGETEIELLDSTSGLRLSAPRFTLGPEKARIRIYRDTKAPPATAPPVSASPTAAERQAIEWVRTLNNMAGKRHTATFGISVNGEPYSLKGGLPKEPWQLTRLTLRRLPKIQDGDLAHVKDLPHLVELDLMEDRVTNAGLVYLKDLTTLRDLSLHGTKITDEGLKHLQNLTALRVLHVGDTVISDAGLANFKNLAELENLSLIRTNIEGPGLAHLKNLKKLHDLHLEHSPINDEGLAHLKELTGLQKLYLSGTKITDRGLKHLEGLKNLVYLDYLGTSVTPEGVKALRKQLPNCFIGGPPDSKIKPATPRPMTLDFPN